MEKDEPPCEELHAQAWDRWQEVPPKQREKWMPPPPLSEDEKKAVWPPTRLTWLQTCLAEVIQEGVFAIGGSVKLNETERVQLLVVCRDSSAVQPPASSAVSSSVSASSPLVEPVIR